MDITIVGGDRRNLFLKDLLEKDGHTVDILGFNKFRRDSISIDDPLNRVVVGGIPFSKNGFIHAPFANEEIEHISFMNKLTEKNVLIAGGISHIDLPCKKFDLLKNEDFLVRNAIITAEGVLQICISETPTSIIATDIVVIGYGRTGSRIASMLKCLGARVTVIANNNRDYSRAAWNGLAVSYYSDLNQVIGKASIIINTAPAKSYGTSVLGSKFVDLIAKDAFVLDISSKPYGVDESIKDAVKTMWVGNIPGKTAPKTGATYIKKAVDECLHLL